MKELRINAVKKRNLERMAKDSLSSIQTIAELGRRQRILTLLTDTETEKECLMIRKNKYVNRGYSNAF